MADINKKLVNGANLKAGLQGVYDKAKTLVDNEKLRAEAQEAALGGRIETLENKFTGDGSVDAKIEAAKNEAIAAAEGKDQTLASTLRGEITTAKGEAQQAAEQTAAQALATAKSELQGKIDLKADASALTEEVSRATGAEEALGGRIDEVVEDVADLTGVVNTKAAQSALEAEVTARGEADTALGGRIDEVAGDVAELQAADAKMQEAIDGLQEAVEGINGAENGILAQAQAYADRKDNEVRGAFAAADETTLQSAKEYADQAITALVDSAPDAMNTLNELATAINANKGVYDAYVETNNAAVAKALEDAKKYADEKDGELHTTITGEVTAAVNVEKTRAEGQEAAIRGEFAAADETNLQAAKVYADGAVAAAIASEVTARDKAISSAVATETQRAEQAETDLGGRIDDVIQSVTNLDTAYKAADATMKEAIEGLQAAVGEGKEGLAGQVKDLEAKLDAAKEQIGKDITAAKDAAIADAEGKDATLKSDLQAEIDSDVKVETDRAVARENAIEAAYKAADTELHTTISGEISSAVDAAKSALQTNIDTKADQTALQNEVTARQGLQTSVVATFNSMKLAKAADTDASIQLVFAADDNRLGNVVTPLETSTIDLNELCMSDDDVEAILGQLK